MTDHNPNQLQPYHPPQQQQQQGYPQPYGYPPQQGYPQPQGYPQHAYPPPQGYPPPGYPPPQGYPQHGYPPQAYQQHAPGYPPPGYPHPPQGYGPPINVVVQNNITPYGETGLVRVADRNKWVAALLAFFAGGFGIHKFYLGQTGLGVVYLLFCWTLIPGFIAFIECLLLLIKSDREFDLQYNTDWRNRIV